MRLHGSSHITEDIDILYSRSADNLQALAKALSGQHPRLRGAPEDLPFLWDARTLRAGLNFTLSTDLGAVDTLGQAAGISSYDDLESRAVTFEVGQPRVFYSMAQDGLFPAFAAKVHPKFGTPWVTTIITGCICSVAGGLLPIGILAELCSIGTLFAFVLVCLGVMILRIKRPEIERGFKVPFGTYLIPILGVLCSGGLMGFATVASLKRLFYWMIVGLILYFVYGAKHSKLQKELRGELVYVPEEADGPSPDVGISPDHP